MKARPSFRPFCPHCENHGVIRIAYESGEPFDLALCECPAGEVWRHVGVAMVRAHFQVSEDCQITDRSAVDDGVTPLLPSHGTFHDAGKTAKRAKL